MLSEKELEKVKRIKNLCNYIATNLIYGSALNPKNPQERHLDNNELSFLTKLLLEHDYLKSDRSEKKIKEQLRNETDRKKRIKLSDELFSSMLYNEAKSYIKKGYVDGFFEENCLYILELKKSFYRSLSSCTDDEDYIKQTNFIDIQMCNINLYLDILKNYLRDEELIKKTKKIIKKEQALEEDNKIKIAADKCLDLFNNYKENKSPKLKNDIVKYAKKAKMEGILKKLD